MEFISNNLDQKLTDAEIANLQAEVQKAKAAKLAKTLYMREYKQKQYHTPAGEIIRERNKSYYIKRKYQDPNADGDIQEYGTLYPLVFNIKRGLMDLKEKNPELVAKVLADFL